LPDRQASSGAFECCQRFLNQVPWDAFYAIKVLLREKTSNRLLRWLLFDRDVCRIGSFFGTQPPEEARIGADNELSGWMERFQPI
jgi:hypothetical protein